MANQEQVALLKQGSKVWNAWRKENPDVEIDLSNAEINLNAEISLINLNDVNLRFADLSNANLRNTNLSNADLRSANLSNVDLSYANLSNVDLSDADLRSVNLSNTNLHNTNLSATNLSNLDLRNLDLRSTNLSFANLNNVNLSNANLSKVNLACANLSNANLSSTDLSYANFSHANLSQTNLSRAKLIGTNLGHASLSHAKLCRTNLGNTNLGQANLSCADLSNTDLSHTNLSHASLNHANLSRANLSNLDLNHADLCNTDLSHANLNCVNLSYADLSAANLSHANLSFADLHASQVLNADFTQATLTGACIADWPNSSTIILKDVQCDYIFRTYDYENQKFSGRLPVDPENPFALDEFSQRFQIIASALETIDITFTEGIDWQAFFQSFQDLRVSRPDDNISIQGMERKGDAFVVRLEVEGEVDKAVIETEVKQRYAQKLAALEAQYQERLRLQSEEIAHHRQAQSSLLHIVQTMAEKDSISQNFHGPVGNVAGTNQGQMTAYINQNNEAISQLIVALRSTAQAFPSEQKDDVLMELDDLESDLSKPEKPEPKRIGKRLQRILAAGTAAVTLAGGAATLTGDLNEFTQNVLELGEKIGLDRGSIQGNP